jgi:3-oxoacyl-[acyl-carrier protein] reductase
MDLGITDKVALVSGGTQGIGFACALAFLREGCKVAIASRTPANVEAAVGKLKTEGGEVIGIAADCASKEGIAAVVAETTQKLGAPDIAIYNVDSGTKGNFMEIDDEVMDLANKNNLMAFGWLVRAVSPHMQDQGWGRILTIGTNSVKEPHRELARAAQNAYRVGALALSKTLSAELGPDGITVNTLGTGAIETDQFKRVFTKIAEQKGLTYEQHIADRVSQWPVRRMGQPEDMANAAAFLCSDLAGYITGQVLVVDGGNIKSLQ